MALSPSAPVGCIQRKMLLRCPNNGVWVVEAHILIMHLAKLQPVIGVESRLAHAQANITVYSQVSHRYATVNPTVEAITTTARKKLAQ